MQPTLTVSSPSPSTTFTCGDYVTVSGSFRYNSCLNTPSTMTVNGVVVSNMSTGYSGPVNGNFAVGHYIPYGVSGVYSIPLNWTYSQGTCGTWYPSGTKYAPVHVVCPVPGVCGSIHGTNQTWPSSGSWCSVGAQTGWQQIGDLFSSVHHDTPLIMVPVVCLFVSLTQH